MSGEKVLVTRRMPEAGVKYLRDEGFDVVEWGSDEPPPRSWLEKEIGDADALFCSLNEKVDGGLLEKAPQLKVVSQLAVGYDNIDVDAATKRKIPVTYTPDVLSPAVADLTWGLILAVSRRIVEADKYVRDGSWRVGFMPVMLPGRNVYGKTLGILGMGRIGSEVAKRSTGFGMKVIYHNRNPLPDPAADAEYVGFDELLKDSDYLVVLVPLTGETKGMIGAKEFEKMKPTAYLINVSRGQVVDQDALTHALEDGVIAGAGLDVLRDEPVGEDDPLLKLSNVVFTPHIGSDTFETRKEMSLMCAKAIHSVLRDGRTPDYSINGGRLR